MEDFSRNVDAGERNYPHRRLGEVVVVTGRRPAALYHAHDLYHAHYQQNPERP